MRPITLLVASAWLDPSSAQDLGSLVRCMAVLQQPTGPNLYKENVANVMTLRLQMPDTHGSSSCCLAGQFLKRKPS